MKFLKNILGKDSAAPSVGEPIISFSATFTAADQDEVDNDKFALMRDNMNLNILPGCGVQLNEQAKTVTIFSPNTQSTNKVQVEYQFRHAIGEIANALKQSGLINGVPEIEDHSTTPSVSASR